MGRKGLILSLLAAAWLTVAAQGDEPRLTLNPCGRILIDGAVYASPEKSMFPDGMAIPEARLGLKMAYGKWSSMLDVSYSYSKIGLRNMWIEYGFSPGNSFRLGNFIHQFGLQSTTSSQKCTFEQPMGSAPFTPGIQCGGMFLHYDPRFYAAASFFVESSALREIMNAPLFNQQGYGLLTRLVWRRPQESGLTLQAGISGGFSTPQRRIENNNDIHDGFTTAALFPTKVAQVTAVEAIVTDSKNLFKVSPEVVATYGRVALEGQYFFQQINRRKGLPGYRSHGGYATLRTLVKGKGYGYTSSTAQVGMPAPGSLECVVDYNFTNLSDATAGILGGRSNSASLTFNYYFNPYITGRLNYTFTHAWNRAGHEPATLNAIQARLMVLF